MLQIAHELELPIDLAGRTQVILAQKGAGKTYTAMREAEQLLEAEQQIVALDPTGVWWGLRSPAPGKHGRGFGVIVMGGDHGDLPLEPSAGMMVADFVIESRQSVILDLSAFESNAAQNRFVTAFALRLYRAKAADRRTIHLMLDEADSFCPQRPGKEETEMLGAFEAIVRRGRSRGLGITLISQRPAVLNKNVMSQADLLVCLRVVGQHDHKALREWTGLYATPEQQKEFMATLPALKTGEAWFWSPSWLNIFQRAQVTKRVSYDSSATPDASVKQSAPAPTVPVNLEELRKKMEATIERVKANDPTELKKQNADLRRRLDNMVQREKAVIASRGKSQQPAADAKPPEIKEVAVITEAQLKGLGKLLDRYEQMQGKHYSEMSALTSHLATAFKSLDQAIGTVRFDANMQKNLHKTDAPTLPPRPIIRSANQRPVGEVSQNGIGSGMRRMMIALAQRPGMSARQVGVRAGLSSSSGTFGTYLSKLRTNSWLDGSRDRMELTAAGVQALGPYDPLPTGQGLLDHWLAEIGQGNGAGRMLDALAKAYPRALSKEELGQAAGISHTSGAFGTYLSKLRSLELITGKGELKASDEFFA